MKPWLVALVGLTLLAYWPVRQASFVYEDDVYVVPAHHALAAREAFAPRGLTALSFRLNALLSGRNPRPYHATNLFLHLLVGLSVYALARRWFSGPWAVITTGLMLLHPLQAQAVAYVAGRAELIAALGTVWVVWALAAPVVTWSAGGVALVAAVVAVGGKELGLVALPLAALYAVWFRSWRWSWRLVGGLVIVATVLGALLLIVLYTRVIGNTYLDQAERGWLAYASLQSTSLWAMVRLAVVPIGLTVDHDVEQWARGLHLLGLILGVGVAGWVVWARTRYPRLTFGIAWLLLSVLPRFVVRQPEYLAEHQIYTASIGLWIASVAMLRGVYQRCEARALTELVS